MTSRASVPGVTARVPGKINLHLAVGPLGEDGFHELATVFHAVSRYDHVTVVPADDWSVTTVGTAAATVPADGSNLALQAARALHQQQRRGRGQHLPPVAISIEKQIPVAGGMAGGSADAAAALVACAGVWDLELSREVLEPVASTLGSDVPFLLHGGTAIGSGRGERIAPVLARGELHWVLWSGRDLHLATPEVYAECDRIRAEQDAQVQEPQISQGLLIALRTMDTAEVGAALHNDLEPAAISLQPVLSEVLASGIDLGAQGGVVSGSGPTVAFLVGSQAEAIDLSVGLAARGPKGDIVRAVGPVGGAHVIGGRGPGPTPGPMTG